MATPDPYGPQPSPMGPPPGQGGMPSGPPGPPPAQPYQAYAAGPEINGKAVAATVCGLLFLTTPLGIMALVFGKTAQRQIEAGYGIGRPLAKAGRILGWVSVGFTIFWALYVVVVIIAVASVSNAVS
ncbi:DUF4190 domain-containing protein [Glycomyces tenuis]|uniref:DUF4190 domain-containing protein n=1 Tax=Glycomyces tenuis TaxID=58116 RepID=UPI0003FBDD6B|nr:DUF4190 domain-containing protein [Glycomyces tenuis]